LFKECLQIFFALLYSNIVHCLILTQTTYRCYPTQTGAWVPVFYVKRFVFGADSISLSENISNKKIGEMYGLEWAERFHYISDLENQNPNNLEKYIKENAKPK